MDVPFTPKPTSHGGGLRLPEFIYPHKGLLRSYEKVRNYYRANPRYLNGSHFLIKLLHSLNVPLTMDTRTYNDHVIDRTFDLAMSLQMTSALYRGRVKSPGVFYGHGVDECLIASVDEFDLDSLETHWQDLAPIRVLSHPKTDLNFPPLLGKYHTLEEGAAVLVINVPMLAGQYRQWRLEDLANHTDQPRSIMQFLTTYPLVNLLESHMDIVLYNRTVCIDEDLPLPEIRNPNPFYLPDYSKEVDATLKHFLELIDVRRLDFDMILSRLPQVFCEDFHERIAFPDMAYSQQLQWALVLVRMPILAFLMQFNTMATKSRNRLYLNLTKRWVRQLRLNRALSHLPKDQLLRITDLIDTGIEPYL